jgi:hypothetical protein
MSKVTTRFDILSRSDSGMHFVRERQSGVMRMLTESEMADFNDPPPCPDCGEQFGCEHVNCAGEPMLADDQVELDVPREWTALARAHGLSRNDLERLRSLEEREGEYHAVPGADMRTLELVCILNER